MLFCSSDALALFFEGIVLVEYSFSFVLLSLYSSSMALSIKQVFAQCDFY